jgi:hypothetical protein
LLQMRGVPVIAECRPTFFINLALKFKYQPDHLKVKPLNSPIISSYLRLQTGCPEWHFCDFPHCLLVDDGVVPQNRPWLVSFALLFLPFYAIYSLNVQTVIK